MPRFSVCIEMIFRDLPVVERIAAVANAGLPAFEFWTWRDKDLDAIEGAAQRSGLRVASLLGAPARRVSMADPTNRQTFVISVAESCAVAKRLRCPTVIMTTGDELGEVPREQQHDAVVRTLRASAPIAEDLGVTLVLEPLNVLVDHRGYYLVSYAEGFQIVEEVGSPNLKLLYDVYHQQISEGLLTQNLRGHASQIGHIHVADTPGRHEPGTGEINYAHIFGVIDELGYGGFVGLEYRPSGDSAASLQACVRIAEGTSTNHVP